MPGPAPELLEMRAALQRQTDRMMAELVRRLDYLHDEMTVGEQLRHLGGLGTTIAQGPTYR